MDHEQPEFCLCSMCSGLIALEHKKADEACDRDWFTGGCQCGVCRLARAYMRKPEEAAAPEEVPEGAEETPGEKPESEEKEGT